MITASRGIYGMEAAGRFFAPGPLRIRRPAGRRRRARWILARYRRRAERRPGGSRSCWARFAWILCTRTGSPRSHRSFFRKCIAGHNSAGRVAPCKPDAHHCFCRTGRTAGTRSVSLQPWSRLSPRSSFSRISALHSFGVAGIHRSGLSDHAVWDVRTIRSKRRVDLDRAGSR
jgi:hypothetical protein